MRIQLHWPATLRLAVLVTLLAALGAITAAPAGAAPAKLDPTFGEGGRVAPTYAPAITSAVHEEPERVAEAVDSHGRTLKVSDSESRRSIERLNPDGSVDESFGCDVTAGCRLLVGIEIEVILPLPSGKVVVAGPVPANEGSPREIAVARLDESGVPDAGFGKNGVIDLQAERSVKGEELIGLAVGRGEDALVALNDEIGKEDGSLVRLGGSKVVAVGVDGNLDAGFGSGGVYGSPDHIGAVEGLPGGGLLVTGEHWVGDPLGPFLRERSSDVYLTRLTAAGAPDPSFGTGGTTTIDLGGIDTASAVLSRPDGSVVVGGATTVSHLTCPYPRQLFCEETPTLEAFTASGSVDTGFGQGGVIRLDPLTFDGAPVMAVGVRALHNLPGGAVLAEGVTWASKFSAQIGPGGALDPGFGDGGIATVTRTHKSGAQVQAIATEASGKILALGGTNAGGVGATPAVFRFRPDGAVGRSFAAGRGFVRMPGHVVALAPDPRGGALVLSGKYSDDTVTRITASGKLDPRFGTEGIAPLPEHATTVSRGRKVKLGVTPRRIVALPGGGIIVSAVAAGQLSTSRIELIRLTPSGALDRSFGHGGVVLIAVGKDGESNPRTLSVLPGGDFLLAGAVRGGRRGAERQTAAVIRLRPDGTPDRSFGTGGVATIPFRGQAVITCVALGRGGEIIVRGTRPVKGGYRLFVARFSASGNLDRSFLRHTAGLPEVDEAATEPPGIFFWAGHPMVPVPFSPDLLVLSRDGRFERRLTLGRQAHPSTRIITATPQRGSLLIATRTTGEPTFTLSRLAR